MLLKQTGSGQVWVYFAMAVPLFISIAGLVIDGGTLLMERRVLQSAADGAARAGASRLDQVRLRAGGGHDVQLDQVLAAQTARAWADGMLADSVGDWQTLPIVEVETTARRVHVTLRGRIRMAFLRVARIESAPVEASAYADIEYGIHDGGGG